MDEHQITDRVEGGRPEPGMTDAAGRAGGDEPRRSPGHRGAAAAQMAVVDAGRDFGTDGRGRAFFRFTSLFDDAIRNSAFQAACLATVLLLAVWYVFFTGLSWHTRLILGGAGFLCWPCLSPSCGFGGSYGDMWFQFVFVGTSRLTRAAGPPGRPRAIGAMRRSGTEISRGSSGRTATRRSMTPLWIPTGPPIRRVRSGGGS